MGGDIPRTRSRPRKRTTDKTIQIDLMVENPAGCSLFKHPTGSASVSYLAFAFVTSPLAFLYRSRAFLPSAVMATGWPVPVCVTHPNPCMVPGCTAPLVCAPSNAAQPLAGNPCWWCSCLRVCGALAIACSTLACLSVGIGRVAGCLPLAGLLRVLLLVLVVCLLAIVLPLNGNWQPVCGGLQPVPLHCDKRYSSGPVAHPPQCFCGIPGPTTLAHVPLAQYRPVQTIWAAHALVYCQRASGAVYPATLGHYIAIGMPMASILLPLNVVVC